MSTSALVVLQARMGSHRLPGKSLAPIDGIPLVTICLRRLLASDAGPVILATTTEAEDDALVAEAQRLNVASVRGSRDDVLERFIQAVKTSDTELVIRATADNPAIDVDGARRAIEATRALRADYCCERNLPLGAAVEVVRRTALLDAATRATEADDREHVTSYVRQQTDRYRVIAPEPPLGLRRPQVRLTIDTPEDLTFMRVVSASVRGGLAEGAFADIVNAAESLQLRSEVMRA